MMALTHVGRLSLSGPSSPWIDGFRARRRDAIPHSLTVSPFLYIALDYFAAVGNQSLGPSSSLALGRVRMT